MNTGTFQPPQPRETSAAAASEPIPSIPQSGISYTLRYVFQVILKIPTSSMLYKQDKILNRTDLVVMSKEELNEIEATVNGINQKISKREARLLQQFTWWYQDIASTKLNSYIPDTEWISYGNEEFENSRRTKVPFMASGGQRTPATSSSSGPVNSDAVLQFQRSIKMEVSQYPEFKGSLDQWLPFKRKLQAITATHGISRLVSRTPPLIAEGSHDAHLYTMQNNFLYSVFTQKISGGPGILALRQYENTKDARAVYLKLVRNYESTTNLVVITQKCYTKINDLKLTTGFKRGAQSFVSQFQNAFLDLEYCTNSKKEDIEKKTMLLQAIIDPSFHSIRDTMAMDSTKDFMTCLTAIDQHATMFVNSQTKRNSKINNTSTDKKNNKKKNKGKTQSNNTRNVNNSNREDNKKKIHMDREVWLSLPQEARTAIINENKKRGSNRGNGNSRQNNTNCTPDSDDNQQEEADTTPENSE